MIPLAVRHLSHSFGGVRALDDLSFEVKPGERRAIIGTNGAGKTTLFNVINGQLAASAGEIRLFGSDVTQLPAFRRAELGIARTFQITSLFPKLSVFENTLIAVQALAPCRFVFYRKASSYRDIFARAQTLLESWKLWDARDEKSPASPTGCSDARNGSALAGNQNCCCWMSRWRDFRSGARLAAMSFLEFDRSITVLLIEHDLNTAFRIADMVTAMDRGRVVAEGAVDEIHVRRHQADLSARRAARVGRMPCCERRESSRRRRA